MSKRKPAFKTRRIDRRGIAMGVDSMRGRPCDEAGEVTDWDPVYCGHYRTRQDAVLGHEAACSALAGRLGRTWGSVGVKARPEGG